MVPEEKIPERVLLLRVIARSHVLCATAVKIGGDSLKGRCSLVRTPCVSSVCSWIRNQLRAPYITTNEAPLDPAQRDNTAKDRGVLVKA